MPGKRIFSRTQYSKGLLIAAISILLLEALFGFANGPDQDSSGSNMVAPKARELDRAVDLQNRRADVRSDKSTQVGRALKKYGRTHHHTPDLWQ